MERCPDEEPEQIFAAGLQPACREGARFSTAVHDGRMRSSGPHLKQDKFTLERKGDHFPYGDSSERSKVPRHHVVCIPGASPDKALKSPEPHCHTFWCYFEQEASLETP